MASASEDEFDYSKYHLFYKAGAAFSNFHPAAFKMTIRQPQLREHAGDESAVPTGSAAGGAGGGSGKRSQLESTEDSLTYEYHCSEQAFMHAKALLFGDYDTAAKIMRAPTPMAAKKLGRQAKGFEEGVWAKHREQVMRAVCSAKFCSIRKLRKAILATAGKTLVEASPRDRIWGIGLSEAGARACDPSQWPGQNLLGKVLTALRDDMIDEKLPPGGEVLELPKPRRVVAARGAAPARVTKREAKRAAKRKRS